MFDPAVFAAAATAMVPGCLLGLVAGLVPGLHANTISHALLAFPGFLVGPTVFAAGAVSGSPGAMAAGAGLLFGMALGHAFTDDVPAVFVGAPDAETALSVLPGHRLLQEGLGAVAVRAAARGSLLGVLFGLPLVPVLAWLMGPPVNGYAQVRPLLPALLVGIAGVLVLSERGGASPDGLSPGRARWLALALLSASAALGELVMFRGMPPFGFYPLGQPALDTGGPLLALFAGLFGLPTLLLATRAREAERPEPVASGQDPLGRGGTLRAGATGTGAGAVVGWLPGIGAAQATTLAFAIGDFLRLRRKGPSNTPREAAAFLAAASAVGTANLLFNLVALSVLQRERSGVMVALNQWAGPIVAEEGLARADHLGGLLAGAVACQPLCYGVTVAAGRAAQGVYRRFPPHMLAIGSVGVILVLVFVLEGTQGLLVAALAVGVGIVPPVAGRQARPPDGVCAPAGGTADRGVRLTFVASTGKQVAR
jgi:putative membrane protein